jgi:hypothetical protein
MEQNVRDKTIIYYPLNGLLYNIHSSTEFLHLTALKKRIFPICEGIFASNEDINFLQKTDPSHDDTETESCPFARLTCFFLASVHKIYIHFIAISCAACLLSRVT